jgi:hypothetical protein
MNINDNCASGYEPQLSQQNVLCSFENNGSQDMCVKGEDGSCECVDDPASMSDALPESFYNQNPWDNYPYGTYKTDYIFDSSNGETDGSYDDSVPGAVLGREFTGDNDDAGTLYNVLSDGTHTTGGGEFLVDKKNIFDIAYHEEDGSSGFYAPEDPLENGMIFTQNTYFYVSNETTIEYYVGENNDDSAILQCGEPGWEGAATNPDTCYIRNENDDFWAGLTGAETIDMSENTKHTMTLSPGWHDLRWAYKQDDGSMNAEFWFGSAGEKKSITEYFDAVYYSQGNHPSTGVGNGLQQLAKSENTSEYCRDGIDNDFDWNGNDTLLINESFYGQNNVNVTVQQPGPWPEYSIGRSIDGLPDFGEPGVDVADPQCDGEQGPEIELYGDHRWNEYYENSILSGNITNNESTKPVETSCFDKYDNDFDGKIDFEDDDCAGNRSVNLEVYYHLGEQYFNWSDPANDAICSDQEDLGKVTETGTYICVNATDGNGNYDTQDPEPGFLKVENVDGLIVPSGPRSYVSLNDQWRECSASSPDDVNQRYTCDTVPGASAYGSKVYRLRECCTQGSCSNRDNPFNENSMLGSFAADQGSPFSGLPLDQTSTSSNISITGINYTLPPGGDIHVTFTVEDTIASLANSEVTVSSDQNSVSSTLSQQPNDAKTGYYKVTLPNSLNQVKQVKIDLDTTEVLASETTIRTHYISVTDGKRRKVCSAEWVDGYDAETNGEACSAYLGDAATTSTMCCGDDINTSASYGERYTDGQKGCWYGQTMNSGQLLSEITKESNDSTVLYYEDEYYQCNGGRSETISHNQSHTGGSLFNNVANYEARGDFICEPGGWREQLDGGDLFTLAAVLQNYTDDAGYDDYSLLCGSADQVVNDLPSSENYDGTLNACALRAGQNTLQDNTKDDITLLLFGSNVSDVDDYLTATASDFFLANYQANVSGCSPDDGTIDLEYCDNYYGWSQGNNGKNPSNVHIYADTADGYTAVTSHVLNDGAFSTNTWSFSNNPITQFFDYLADSVKSVFQTSQLPSGQTAQSQALYVAEGQHDGNDFVIASGVYGDDGNKPYMKTEFDNVQLFNESSVSRTLQRYYPQISDNAIGQTTNGVNVSSDLTPQGTDPIRLWKQMTVSTR